MKIVSGELQQLENLLRQKLIAGNMWLVYKNNVEELSVMDLVFFKKRMDAERYIRGDSQISSRQIYLPVFRDYIAEQIVDQHTFAGVPKDVNIDMDVAQVLAVEKGWMRTRAEDLNETINAWGLPFDMCEVFEQAISTNNTAIVFEHKASRNKDQFTSTLFLQPNADGYYEIHAFASALKKNIIVPDATVGDINSKELEKEMAKVEWSKLDPVRLLTNDNDKDVEKLTYKGIAFHLMLSQLALSEIGAEAAEKLMAKYWLGTSFEGLIKNVEELDKKYITHQNFDKIGKTIFTLTEAYNLMSERYVCKKTVEHDQEISPWYYRFAEAGASSSNIVRVANSEHLDIEQAVDRLLAKNIVPECSRGEFVRSLRMGEEMKAEEISDGFKQQCKVYFNPFLNELEATKWGSKVKIDQRLDNDLGRNKKMR